VARADGVTPLHLACFLGNLEIAKWLAVVLESTSGSPRTGSSQPATSCFTIKTKEGFTPLHLAAHNEQIEILEEFKSHVPSDLILHLATRASLSSLKYLLSFVDVTVRDANKRTILHLAVELGLEENVLAILNHTQAPRANDNNSSSLSADFAKSTLPTASLQTIIDEFDSRNHTPLYIAVSQGHRTIVQHLLKAGANPALCADDGGNALHQAAFCGRGLILRDMLTHVSCRELVNSRDADGKTPLHKLCWNFYDCVDDFKLLVEAGADINAESKYQYTPLHWYDCIIFPTSLVV
jgi:ankyrin repeat protein